MQILPFVSSYISEKDSDETRGNTKIIIKKNNDHNYGKIVHLFWVHDPFVFDVAG